MNHADLPSLLQSFFTDRLLRQRQASPHTIAGYRDSFRLRATGRLAAGAAGISEVWQTLFSPDGAAKKPPETCPACARELDRPYKFCPFCGSPQDSE